MTRYESLVKQIKQTHAIRIHRWRSTMSGCAWCAWYADGTQINWIESPFPRSAVSLLIFLHEVGHHVIGFDTYKLRCEEELAAWIWALSEMRARGIEPDARCMRRVEVSMRHSVGKAVRRGLRKMPASLIAYAA